MPGHQLPEAISFCFHHPAGLCFPGSPNLCGPRTHLSFPFQFCIPRAVGGVPKWSPALCMHRASCGQWPKAARRGPCRAQVSRDTSLPSESSDVHLSPSGVTDVLWPSCQSHPGWVGRKYQFNHQSLQEGRGKPACPCIMGAPMPVQPPWRAMASAQPSSNPQMFFSSHSTSGDLPSRCNLYRHQDTHTRDTNKRCLQKHHLWKQKLKRWPSPTHEGLAKYMTVLADNVKIFSH